MIRAHERIHRALHKAHIGTHLIYFGLVFIEAHSAYGFAAGALFVLTLVQAWEDGGH